MNALKHNTNCAIAILNEVNQTLQKQPDSLLKIRSLQSLGNALSIAGDLKQAEETLQQSLKISQSLQPPQDQGSIFLNLGNTARAQKNIQGAIA